MKNLIKKNAITRFIANIVYYGLFSPFISFTHSGEYWKKRYRSGKNSGDGSYHKLASFKADVINNFIDDYKINSAIEFGCGDGNQLKLINYPHYIGFDISPEALSLCSTYFSHDNTKHFKLIENYSGELADITVSLDVLYHLIEDSIFEHYMEHLFNASTHLVLIYSSNTNRQRFFQSKHIKHRKFTDWIEHNKPRWNLIRQIPNKYPFYGDDTKGSFADFYLYEKN